MTEMVTIPKKEYEELLEIAGILSNDDMVAALQESMDAKRRGVKPWTLHL